MDMKKKRSLLFGSILICMMILLGLLYVSMYKEGTTASVTVEDIPEYNGQPYVEINDNKPDLGRCTMAQASISQDTMPTQDRESISSVKPSGWENERYDFVPGGWVYNRCHLIGYQLTGENANQRNLITGTRYMNTEGMLPFENEIAEYVKETDDHVLYEVTPIYEGNDLVASGVHMQACSVEDDCESLSFNIYAYNVQPGIEIDYATGENKEE